MDIWETLYEKARGEYHPEDVTPFIHAHHVVCALESVDGRIYTGFCIESCCGVMDLCAERTAALNMYMNSGQTQIRRLIAFRDRDLEILVDYESRQTVTLGELMPAWWGEPRYRASAEPSAE